MYESAINLDKKKKQECGNCIKHLQDPTSWLRRTLWMFSTRYGIAATPPKTAQTPSDEISGPRHVMASRTGKQGYGAKCQHLLNLERVWVTAITFCAFAIHICPCVVSISLHSSFAHCFSCFPLSILDCSSYRVIMSENPSIAISEPSVQSQAAPSTRKPRPSKRKSGGSAALPAAGSATGPSEARKGKRSVKSGKQPRAQRLTQRAVFEPFCDEKTLESGLQVRCTINAGSDTCAVVTFIHNANLNTAH